VNEFTFLTSSLGGDYHFFVKGGSDSELNVRENTSGRKRKVLSLNPVLVHALSKGCQENLIIAYFSSAWQSLTFGDRGNDSDLAITFGTEERIYFIDHDIFILVRMGHFYLV
jgi:hypothetical protein